jgi:hypothetical protein
LASASIGLPHTFARGLLQQPGGDVEISMCQYTDLPPANLKVTRQVSHRRPQLMEESFRVVQQIRDNP